MSTSPRTAARSRPALRAAPSQPSSHPAAAEHTDTLRCVAAHLRARARGTHAATERRAPVHSV
eukprot:scaffold79449_cov41-Tisochrysis_lutea.AAC.1